jgi:hypothetical protein
MHRYAALFWLVPKFWWPSHITLEMPSHIQSQSNSHFTCSWRTKVNKYMTQPETNQSHSGKQIVQTTFIFCTEESYYTFVPTTIMYSYLSIFMMLTYCIFCISWPPSSLILNISYIISLPSACLQQRSNLDLMRSREIEMIVKHLIDNSYIELSLSPINNKQHSMWCLITYVYIFNLCE